MASVSLRRTSSSTPSVGGSDTMIATSRPPSLRFFDKSPSANHARSTYLKIFIGGTFSVILMVFTILPIYWGSLWKVPARNLHGWVVDFDGGFVGQSVSQALASGGSPSRVTWTVQPAERFNGSPENLAHSVREEETWVAIAILPGVSSQLNAALAAPNSSYDGSRAITAYAVEARNENAYRSLIRPSVEGSLIKISAEVALQVAKQAANSPVLQDIFATSPQTIVSPVYFHLENLIPFDQPVATASTFVGMLYQLIMGFFVVMIALAAREASGYDRHLPTPRLIALRLASSITAYFFISLFYSLMNLAFKLDINRKYGHSGFLVFWMINWVGMLAVCLALESMITILTPKGVPFFMLLWIITNLSVSIFPIEVLPSIFRYGYAFPFYNMSRSLRTIVFGTKNTVGQSFGILIAWAAVSCLTLSILQWVVRRGSDSDSLSQLRDQELRASNEDLDKDTNEKEKQTA